MVGHPENMVSVGKAHAMNVVARVLSHNIYCNTPTSLRLPHIVKLGLSGVGNILLIFSSKTKLVCTLFSLRRF